MRSYNDRTSLNADQNLQYDLCSRLLRLVMTSRLQLTEAATQAPQPIQAAASKARSASALGTGMVEASGAAPVLTETKPPAAMMRSKAVRSTAQSRITGNAAARHGSITMVSPSLNFLFPSLPCFTHNPNLQSQIESAAADAAFSFGRSPAPNCHARTLHYQVRHSTLSCPI